MSKPTFNMIDRNHNIIATIPYTPIIFIAGTTAHKLALHRSGTGGWKVSHPIIGGGIVDVKAYYKGVPVSSKHLSATVARNLAIVALEQLCERVGSDLFNRNIEKAMQNV